MKNLSMFAKIVICLGFVSLGLFSCSVSKKIQAASILKQCNFSFKRASMDGFRGDSLVFSVFLNAHNKGNDSLFVQGLNGMLYLDSLFEIPISLQKSVWLSPGNNELNFSGAFQLNLFKLLAVPNLKKFTIRGIAYIALKPDQKAIEVDFNETRDIPPNLLEKQIKGLIGL
ncbi:MAG: hypothetical protein LBC64_00985 [Fibromonadaceae bacterium]|nr:hypothetical protein [Fibromonadaceae bacterium]